MDKRIFVPNELRRVAAEVAPKAIRKRDLLRLSDVSDQQLRSQFESWNTALTEVGLESAPPERKRLSDDELMDAIGDLWERIGRRPTESALHRDGKYSKKPYYQRWGSFSRAVDYYVNHGGVPTPSADSPSFHDGSSVPGPSHRRARAVRVVPTHKPIRPRERRLLVGEPIDFRGLRYVPVNEQGVVYLFGMVSRELGFLIETVRTEYPDCEGKRRLDEKGDRWDHVRIEFEYKSKNFLLHGHDPEQCDLIVCWVHDWPASPIEILELQSTLKYLPI